MDAQAPNLLSLASCSALPARSLSSLQRADMSLASSKATQACPPVVLTITSQTVCLSANEPDKTAAEIYMEGHWYFTHSVIGYGSDSLGWHFFQCMCYKQHYACSSSVPFVAGIMLDITNQKPILLANGGYVTCVLEGDTGLSADCPATDEFEMLYKSILVALAAAQLAMSCTPKSADLTTLPQ
ncbi:uncharacterized protein L969DRAFT_101834 [Mixia osmundae IAM 14324]|uniref:Uncharacterized protein n=1 Tax=Mixia osmundae (strain CBS 9802 / IAM 14324 / JCM 22182 / KY 12970) TaxID=764103 RepID=G7DYT4_MIXOS|nr:uncharacterized protein L969DRAFT_101834 [Mixia osmundae IAM 14324]KEI41640.1 hypothetical protein L969DRAFT_101834 [Mixia osmundae IAM 14324]GAA95744.1 hypothetical protein E5Q_02401 [Mixia osmundae IAM 14324]